MKTFPKWAPPALIEQLARTKAFRSKYPSRHPEEIISDSLKRPEFAAMSTEAVARFRESLYRFQIDLPGDEGTDVLERLLTDLRMKPVWESLQRRNADDKAYVHFWNACSAAIVGWRGEQKLTAKEKRDFYKQMYERAVELENLIVRARDFQFYSINNLIDGPTVEWLVETLNIEVFDDPEKNADYVKFCLSDVVPRIHLVLEDIAKKAQAHAAQEPVVLKPGSDNAHVHYFVRSMSRYVLGKFGQPLHEVVAATASVALENVDIDADLVRKLVR